jgi:hypothetical protein
VCCLDSCLSFWLPGTDAASEFEYLLTTLSCSARTASPTLYWRAPEIVESHSDFTSGRITLNVTFSPPASYPGRMYCAALLTTGNTTIDNVGQIVAAGAFVPYFEGDYRANIAISGLRALSSYVTYCYFETAQGVGNNLATVRATRELHTTACCKTIAFTSAPSVLYGDPTSIPPTRRAAMCSAMP